MNKLPRRILRLLELGRITIFDNSGGPARPLKRAPAGTLALRTTLRSRKAHQERVLSYEGTGRPVSYHGVSGCRRAWRSKYVPHVGASEVGRA